MNNQVSYLYEYNLFGANIHEFMEKNTPSWAFLFFFIKAISASILISIYKFIQTCIIDNIQIYV